jgi:hypothetical protein
MFRDDEWLGVVVGFVVVALFGLAIYANWKGNQQFRADCEARSGTVVQFDDDVDPICWTPQMGNMPVVAD